MNSTDLSFIPCTLKDLPPEDLFTSARTAIAINPANLAPMWAAAMLTIDTPPEPAHLALLTSKYWGAAGVKLTVQFLDNPSVDLRRRILDHMNAWNRTANVLFTETQQLGQVRIARNEMAYYSYLGTDILHVPPDTHTMMLGGFSDQTSESEFQRVVEHETGHTLGFPHEHMRRQIVSRLDQQKTIAYFWQTQGWSAQVTKQQVLTPLEDQALMATPQADEVSVMCYQLPGSITTDGRPVVGGNGINDVDAKFAATLYPKLVVPPPPKPPPPVVSKYRVTLEIDADNFRGVTVVGLG